MVVASIGAVLVTVSSIGGSGNAAPESAGATQVLVGTIGLVGGFRGGADGTVSVEVNYDILGPLDVTFDGGTMSGSWSMEGTSVVSGELISGSGTHSGSGTLGGTPGAYRMLGSITSAASVTMSNPRGDITSDSPPETYQFDEPLTDVMYTCDRISGRWDARLIAGTAAVENVTPTFFGYFFGVSTGSGDAAVDAARRTAGDLARLADEWAVNATPTADLGLVVAEGFLLLSAMQDALAQLPPGSGCDPQCAFTTPLARPAADVVRAMIDVDPGIVTSSTVSLLLGSGALSSCHDGAEDLLTDLRLDLDVRFAELLGRIETGEAALSDPATVAQLTDVALTAIALGSETIGPDGVAPGDILLVLGVGA